MNEKYLAVSIVGAIALLVITGGTLIAYRLLVKDRDDRMMGVLAGTAFLALLLALVIGAIIEGNVT